MTSAAGWDDLARECDAWAAAGRPVELWWRDDDAVADTPELRRLLALAAGRAPLALAVIPAGLQPSLPAAVETASGTAAGTAAGAAIAVLQHGYDHRNRAAAEAKKSEFPPDRPAAEVAEVLAQGRRQLAAAFGARFVPVLTPPWNRFDAAHLPVLRDVGLRGLSAYLPRRNKNAAPGVSMVNTHVDVIDWHRPGPAGAGQRRPFVGTDAALALLARHLAAKRDGAADAAEPTGLLTHHLVHDTETWQFLGELLDWCAARPGIAWRKAADLFPEFGV